MMQTPTMVASPCCICTLHNTAEPRLFLGPPHLDAAAHQVCRLLWHLLYVLLLLLLVRSRLHGWLLLLSGLRGWLLLLLLLLLQRSW